MKGLELVVVVTGPVLRGVAAVMLLLPSLLNLRKGSQLVVRSLVVLPRALQQQLGFGRARLDLVRPAACQIWLCGDRKHIRGKVVLPYFGTVDLLYRRMRSARVHYY